MYNELREAHPQQGQVPAAVSVDDGSYVPPMPPLPPTTAGTDAAIGAASTASTCSVSTAGTGTTGTTGGGSQSYIHDPDGYIAANLALAEQYRRSSEHPHAAPNSNSDDNGNGAKSKPNSKKGPKAVPHRAGMSYKRPLAVPGGVGTGTGSTAMTMSHRSTAAGGGPRRRNKPCTTKGCPRQGRGVRFGFMCQRHYNESRGIKSIFVDWRMLLQPDKDNPGKPQEQAQEAQQPEPEPKQEQEKEDNDGGSSDGPKEEKKEDGVENTTNEEAKEAKQAMKMDEENKNTNEEVKETETADGDHNEKDAVAKIVEVEPAAEKQEG
jgi:hypothetical protein